MADRGRLFYDSNGKLRQVDPDATLDGEPAEADLEPVEMIDARLEQLDYDGLTPDYRLTGPLTQADATSNTSTTSTTYPTTIFFLRGAFDISDIPTNSTLYGRLFMNMQISDAAETVFIRPRIRDEVDGGATAIPELEISHTGDTAFTMVDSGWVEITTDIGGSIVSPNQLSGKVSGGTGTYNYLRHGLHFAGVTGVA